MKFLAIHLLIWHVKGSRARGLRAGDPEHQRAAALLDRPRREGGQHQRVPRQAHQEDLLRAQGHQFQTLRGM